MVKKYWVKCAHVLNVAVLGALAFGAENKIDVPLFLLSGQSNMVGMQNNVNDLSSDQKKEVENVKIYLSVGQPSFREGDAAKSNKWTTLGPGYGTDRNNMGPELFFGRIISEAMPDKKFAIIKDGVSGTPLGQSSGWLPPSSGGPGALYKNMMSHIEDALKKFNDAYDTSEYQPRWAGFLWLQGESDAINQNDANKYEGHLSNLIKDIREMAEDDSMPVIIPMIDNVSTWRFNGIVRAAEVAMTEKFVNVDTMDTHRDDIGTNGIHYSAKGQVVIGSVSAERWLAMEYCKDWWIEETAALHRSIPVASRVGSTLSKNSVFFDLFGRKINVAAVASGSARQQRNSPPIMMIRSSVTKSGERKILKTLDLR